MTTELNTIASNSQAVATAESFRPSAYDSPEAQALREMSAKRDRSWLSKQTHRLMSTKIQRGRTAFGIGLASGSSYILSGVWSAFFWHPGDISLLIGSLALSAVATGALVGNWARTMRPAEKRANSAIEQSFEDLNDWLKDTYGFTAVPGHDAYWEDRKHQMGMELLGFEGSASLPLTLRSEDGDYEVKATLRETSPGIFELLKGHDVDAAKAIRFTPIASTHALTASRTFELPAGEQPKAELSALSMSREV